MKIVKHILLIFLIFNNITTYAQKVSNVTFRQEQSTIIVYYDLETKTPCKISLFVSTDDGKTWQGALKKVSGDSGAKIASGSHSITWNVLEEFEELRGDKIKFQVRADAIDLETVIIGTQEWTVKNLDVSRYRNGDIIPEVKDPKEWTNYYLKSGAWCYYNNDPENGKIYGKLYNWYAVNDPRGLAPEGFHIPSDEEWSILINYLGGEEIAAEKIKEQGTEHWNGSNSASNSTNFTGLPGGLIYTDTRFSMIGDVGYWWSSSEFSIRQAWFYNFRDFVHRSHVFGKEVGLSIRCIKD